jgi:tripartite-type tricarboxylate transporter receptor subunit TctC
MHGLLVGVVIAVAALAGPASAQTFPAKPVRLVIPFAPGGATDTIGRAVAQKLSERWSQPVVVDNRPGAATSIAAEYVAKSPADGYTLLLAANETLAINPSLFTRLSYDPVRDFAMVRGLFAAKHILLVHPSVPANSLGELVAYMKANPDKLSYASSGNGSPAHLNMELFKTMAGVSALHVPYKGAAPAMTELLGGGVQLMLINIAISRPHLKSGRLKTLAIASDTRSPVMPDLPTFAESGYPGFDSFAWFGLVAPAGTPRTIVERIGTDAAAALSSPDIRDQKLVDQGLEPFALTPEQFAALVARESEKYARMVRQTGAKAD